MRMKIIVLSQPISQKCVLKKMMGNRQVFLIIVFLVWGDRPIYGERLVN